MTKAEADIRRIVKEEITLALDSLVVEACKLDDHDTGELLAAGLSAVARSAAAAVEIVNHAVTCQLREDSRYARCTCGIRDY